MLWLSMMSVFMGETLKAQTSTEMIDNRNLLFLGLCETLPPSDSGQVRLGSRQYGRIVSKVMFRLGHRWNGRRNMTEDYLCT